MNTIEMLDLSLYHQNVVTNWNQFDIRQDQGPMGATLTARQGLGTCQIDSDGILILGGYTGRFNADSFYLNVGTRTL
jgi:hypothetical protein